MDEKKKEEKDAWKENQSRAGFHLRLYEHTLTCADQRTGKCRFGCR